MGWFGMPGHNENSAFDVLFSQSQYSQKFELIEQKHRYNKSFALYTLDGKYRDVQNKQIKKAKKHENQTDKQRM